MSDNSQPAGAKTCETPKCNKPGCVNQDVMQRGPNTRRPMSEFNDGNSCPEYGPKLIGTVNMGPNAIIDLKIARTGVQVTVFELIAAWPSCKTAWTRLPWTDMPSEF